MFLVSRLSIRVLMGGVIGLLGLLLLGLATQALVKASVNYAMARRMVELSLTGREVLALTWATTIERGDNLYALLGEAPIKPATEQAIAERRAQSLVHADKAGKLLAVLQAGPEGAALADPVTQFRNAYSALAALRPAVDSAERLPRAEREVGLADRWRDAADRLMSVLILISARVDAATELHAPLIDLLLAAKRAAVAARYDGSLLSGLVSGSIAAAKPWSQSDIVRAAELRGRIAAEWDAVTHAAMSEGITAGLKGAVGTANAVYFGTELAYRQPILDALAAGRPPGVTIEEWLAHAMPSTGSVANVAEAALDDVVAVAESNIAEARHSLLTEGAVLLVAMTLTGSGFLIVWVRVSRPVMLLAQVMRRLEDRDFTVDVPGTDRADELGAMAKTVETFRANGVAMQLLEAAAAEQRRIAEAEREAADARQARQAAELAEVVDGLGAALARLADGDLTCAVERQFAPEYERLRIDLNAALSGLAAAMRDITQHGDTISSGTQKIAGATDDLARRTEQQAATLEQTAAALQEIVGTVGKTAAGSQEARVIATEAQGDAERSGQVVRDAVVAMDAIAGSARQISQIIGVIDEIAFQTNLLALNAGVEAARAGEAGRGFAVVASEVRALAQRSADAAKQIKALITTSSQQVERGVALVGETGNTLGRILGQMGTISRVIGDIAASVQRQAEALGEVNTAVSEMDKVTQQNAAMVEQTAAATRALSHETEMLSAANGRFRIEKTRITRAA